MIGNLDNDVPEGQNLGRTMDKRKIDIENYIIPAGMMVCLLPFVLPGLYPSGIIVQFIHEFLFFK